MSKAYTPEQIAEIIQGDLITHEHRRPVHHLVFDTRKIIFPEASVFFALKTDKNDGHLFIRNAYHSGIRVFVIDSEIESNFLLSDVTIIEVDNVIDALQDLARYHRSLFSLPIIGITGSNGKTIVKEWLNQLLNPEFRIIRSPRSYNSQIGVPLSVWQLDDQAQMGIFEVGISQPREMDKLEPVVRPTIGVFTTIGDSHDRGFKSTVEKIHEKLSLFSESQKLIYSTDFVGLDKEIKRFVKESNPSLELKTWSFNKRRVVNLSIYKTKRAQDHTLLFARYKREEISLKVPFTDKASLENVATCWLLMLEKGYQNAIISGRILELQSISMRIEQKKGINNCILINDAYSFDIKAFEIALDFLNQHALLSRKTLFLSSFQELGEKNDARYKMAAKITAAFKLDRLFLIGEEISSFSGLFSSIEEVHTYESTEAFLLEASTIPFNNEAILLKGSRRFGFEQIEQFLSDKSHDTTFEINLDAIKQNFECYKKMLKPKVKVMVMVKAFSYGSGSSELANYLQYHNADYLAVAYTDEGVKLRKDGIELPIMVMNPERGSLNKIVRYNLEPVIYDLKQFNHFTQYLRSIGNNVILPIHVEINTGMNRLGIEPNLVFELCKRLRSEQDFFKVESIFTHLSAADEEAGFKSCNQQVASFNSCYEQLAAMLSYSPLKHVCNSAGIVNFPDFHFDMVRLGLGVYGIDPTGKVQSDLLGSGKFKTVISQIRNVSKGASVGYGIQSIVDRPTTLATIAIGYADGIRRSFGEGKVSFLVNEKFSPIIGTVCMDMCMLDISDIEASEGDEVIIFGPERPLQDLCTEIDMIPYEMLTGISERVKRIYIRES